MYSIHDGAPGAKGKGKGKGKEKSVEDRIRQNMQDAYGSAYVGPAVKGGASTSRRPPGRPPKVPPRRAPVDIKVYANKARQYKELYRHMKPNHHQVIKVTNLSPDVTPLSKLENELELAYASLPHKVRDPGYWGFSKMIGLAEQYEEYIPGKPCLSRPYSLSQVLLIAEGETLDPNSDHDATRSRIRDSVNELSIKYGGMQVPTWMSLAMDIGSLVYSVHSSNVAELTRRAAPATRVPPPPDTL